MKKRIYYLALSFACIVAFLATFSIAQAQPRPYKWHENYIVNGKLTVGINSDYVDKNYYSSNEITAGINKWKNIGANLNLSEVSYSQSVIDITSVTSQQWTNNGWGSSFLAFERSSKSGVPCKTHPIGADSCSAGDKITHSAIFLNEGNMPDGLLPSTRKNRREALIAHELGHSFQLDHNGVINQNSIMKSGAWNADRFSFTPTTHDVNNINSQYN